MNKEHEKIKNKIMKPLIVIGVIIIPLMYSFFYLKAFWDPYSNLTGIPIALVNEDKGNEEENLGKKLVDKLVDQQDMKFQLVDKETAEKGLNDKTYYAMIDVPEDFTEKLNSGETENKQSAQIIYSPNQKSNFLASQIITSAVNKIEKQVQQEVTEKVVDNLSDKLGDVPTQMEKIEDASNQLKDGSQSLTDGLQTIDNGMGSLSTNYDKFNDGVSTVDQATKSLDGGVDQLKQGLDQVYSGSKELNEKTQALSQITDNANTIAENEKNLDAGIGQYVEGVNELTTQVASLKDIQSDLQKMLAENPQLAQVLMQDSNFQSIMKKMQEMNSKENQAKLQKLSQSGAYLQKSSKKLNAGIQQFATATEGLKQINPGIQKLEDGVAKVKDGANTLKDGSRQLSEGATTLQNSSQEIRSGIQQLKDGTSSALLGSKTLLDGQQEFTTEVGNSIADARSELKKLDGLSTFTGNAVQVDEQDVEPVSKYGVGFAPYFMSLSLWIGGLLIFVGIYFDPHDRFKRIGRNAKNRAFRSLVYLLIAVAQAVVLGFILKVTLGMEIQDNWLYYGSCILVSVTFLSIIQCLMVNFGDVGKFLVILFLVVQLSACGGTFPLETLPDAYQQINPFMPMTYSLNLFKESIVGRSQGFVTQDVNALLGIMITFIVITFTLDLLHMFRNRIHRYFAKRKKNKQKVTKTVSE